MPIDRICGGSKRTGAERGDVHPCACIGKTQIVAQEHLTIRKDVVCEGYGLRSLQMGVACHNGFRMGGRDVHDGLKQLL